MGNENVKLIVHVNSMMQRLNRLNAKVARLKKVNTDLMGQLHAAHGYRSLPQPPMVESK